ncbi:MAG: hypothetical protein KatS3mg102_1404 [Planctomycetota bacterium]|nr:MAG: hypothetical protein KatS3mg102_1404 [Planctomycetota bacterium]
MCPQSCEGPSERAPACGPCPDDETLAALLDGALGEAEGAAVQAHLLGCDGCRAAVAAAARALARPAGGGAAAGGDCPPELLARALAAVAGRAAAAASGGPGHRDTHRGRRVAFRPLRAAAAVWLVAAAGYALWLAAGRTQPAAPAGSGPERAAAGARSTGAQLQPHAGSERTESVAISEVQGEFEVRLPGSEQWQPLVAGAQLPPGTVVRATDPEPSALVIEHNLTLAFRRQAEVVLAPGAGSLELELRQGGLAASPAEGARALSIALPQGRVRSAGGSLEVLRKRRGALVVARSAAGAICTTPFGEVRLGEDEHTVLYDGRPPRRPRRWGEGEPPPWRKHGWRHCPPSSGPPCAPPGGPELDELFERADDPS